VGEWVLVAFVEQVDASVRYLDTLVVGQDQSVCLTDGIHDMLQGTALFLVLEMILVS